MKKKPARIKKRMWHKLTPFALLASALVAGVIFIQTGSLNQTTKKTPSNTVSAVPAQPFPGERMPAIPAIPAVHKPKTENTIAIHSPAGGAGWVRGRGHYFSTLQIEWGWNLKGNVEKFTINLLKSGTLYKKLATVDVSTK